MSEPAFITRPMSVWLDLVRALAALAVVLGHSFRLGIYDGPFVVSMALEKDAVIVFFVLSGLVIAGSSDSRGDTATSFAIARIARIVPVTVGAILVAVAVAALDANLGTAPLFPEHRAWSDPVELAEAVLFVSESYNSNFALNPPQWSLCYEVWFYALFAAATFARGRARVLWLLAIAVAAGPNVLLLLPAWLVGVWLARSPAAREVPRGKAPVLVAAGVAGLFVMPRVAPAVFEVTHAVLPWNLGYSLYAVTDVAMAIGIGLGFMGLRTLAAGGWTVPARCEAPVRWLAGSSFSLYLLHWPLLELCRMAGIGAGDSLLALAAILAAVVVVSAAFATVIERKRYLVRGFLQNLVSTRRAAVGAT